MYSKFKDDRNAILHSVRKAKYFVSFLPLDTAQMFLRKTCWGVLMPTVHGRISK